MTTDSGSGYRLLGAMEDMLRDRAMQAQMTFRCTFCAAWAEGAAGDVLQFASEHRRINHPAAIDRGQKARRAAAKAAPISYWTGRSAMGEM